MALASLWDRPPRVRPDAALPAPPDDDTDWRKKRAGELAYWNDGNRANRSLQTAAKIAMAEIARANTRDEMTAAVDWYLEHMKRSDEIARWNTPHTDRYAAARALDRMNRRPSLRNDT